MDWQPIETVPQQGPVLIYRDGLMWITYRPWMTWAQMRKQPKATYWMPMPEPPSTEGQR